MIKICNSKGKTVCYADPKTGIVEMKSGKEKSTIQLSPGQSFYHESDGVGTVIEFEGSGHMYHRSYRV